MLPEDFKLQYLYITRVMMVLSGDVYNIINTALNNIHKMFLITSKVAFWMDVRPSTAFPHKPRHEGGRCIKTLNVKHLWV